MDDVMRGSMVSTPPPMVVTFAEDYPGAGVRIVERWWPGRVLIDGRLIDQALRGETRVLRVSRAVDDINAPLVAAFLDRAILEATIDDAILMELLGVPDDVLDRIAPRPGAPNG
jgi:hypothetical protein